jgi:hypothetical protein
MLTASNKFESELKRRIDEETKRVLDELMYGQALKDYADYRYRLGKLHAFSQIADSICDEVNTTINER